VESTAAFFWIRIYDFEASNHRCFNLDIVALNNDTTYLLKYRNLHDATQFSSLALVYIRTTLNGPDYSASNKRRLEELLAGLIELGHDLHESPDGISPLLRMLHDKYKQPFANEMETRLDQWLTLLKTTGVDLRLYGQEEWHRFQALRRNCDRPWDWRHGVRDRQCGEVADKRFPRLFDTSEYPPTLTAFTYGEEVSDWKLWLLHPGDQHAGQFWRLIEQNGIYNRHVPGGWVEDEQL
jgi:hypothetical protein